MALTRSSYPTPSSRGNPTTNTVVTADRNLIKENVHDIINNIDPTMTPFYSSLSRSETMQPEFETPVDELHKPVNNIVRQGQDAAYLAAPSPTRVKGHVQLMDKALIISDTAQATETYGYGSEMGYQMGKVAKELRRDIEHRLCNPYSAVKATASVAGQTGSISSWIKTNFRSRFDETNSNASKRVFADAKGYNKTSEISETYTVGKTNEANDMVLGSVAADPYPDSSATDAARYTAALGSWDEQVIRDMITDLAQQQDSINVPKIMFSLKNKEVASRTLNGVAPFRKDFGKGSAALQAVASIDLYKSDFGTHMIEFNRWMFKNWIAFVDPRYFGLRFLQPWSMVNLARTGHARKRMLKVEWGLECRQEKAHGLIVGVTG